MPYGLISRDEHPTSNIERPITPRRDFFSAVLILVTKILINLYDSHRKLKQPFFKIVPLLRHLFSQSPFAVQYWFFYSSFDVGRSMFDVHLFQ